MYLYYLVSYFGAMVAIIVYAIFSKKIEKATHAILIAGSVFINICIWLFEQLVKMDFELLSVSYILTELFLLGIHLLLQEKEEERKEKEAAFIKNMLEKSAEAKKSAFYIPKPKPEENEDFLFFNECLSSLTATERKLLELHLSGKKTKDIMEELCITENTLKFHNKNIYRKFGVSSKKRTYRTLPRKRNYVIKKHLATKCWLGAFLLNSLYNVLFKDRLGKSVL